MANEELKNKPAEQEDLEIKPVDQEVKEEDLKNVSGGCSEQCFQEDCPDNCFMENVNVLPCFWNCPGNR